MNYVAQWPILDDELRLSDLIREARGDLARLMCRDGVEATGIPEWGTSEWAGQLFLDVQVEAEPRQEKEAA